MLFPRGWRGQWARVRRALRGALGLGIGGRNTRLGDAKGWQALDGVTHFFRTFGEGSTKRAANECEESSVRDEDSIVFLGWNGAGPEVNGTQMKIGQWERSTKHALNEVGRVIAFVRLPLSSSRYR
jgi:hypothetical protein